MRDPEFTATPWRSRFNLSRWALNNPGLTIAFWLGVAVAGIFAFSSLRYALFPDVSFPIVLVDSSFPIEDVYATEEQLTLPLETQLEGVAKLESYESSTYAGRSIIRLRFGVGTQLDDAYLATELRLKGVDLPPEAQLKIVPFDLNESSAITYIIRGETRKGKEPSRQVLYERSLREVVPVLTKLRGVLRVELMGTADLDREANESNPAVATPFAAQTLTRWNGNDVLAIQVIKEPQANTLDIVDRVQAAIDSLRKQIPDLRIETASTQASFIREATQATIDSLLGAIVLAVAIIYPFLRSWRATLITALAIPLSLLGTFIVMAWQGFNLETITLLALALVIGIIVDDAIVDVENISRHLAEGRSPYRAALEATSEIGLTVSAATLTIVAVFLPVGSMGGTIGQFFKPFGITVSASVLISLLVARTLSPVLAMLWLRPRDYTPGEDHSEERGETIEPRLPVFSPSDSVYSRTLTLALNHRFWVVVLAILSLVAGIGLIPFIPQGFIPKLDRGEFNVTYQISPAYLEKTLRERFKAPTPQATEDDQPLPSSVEGNPTEGAEQLATYAKFLEGLAPEQLARLKQLKRRAAKTYVVKSGQDLRDIADRFLSSPDRWPVIAKINGLEDFRDVEPGEAIVVLDLPLGGTADPKAQSMSPEEQFAPIVLAESRQFAQQLESPVLANEQVEAVFSILGERGAINQGRLYVKLKDDRTLHTAIVQEQIRSALPRLDGASASLEDIQFVDTGGDLPLKIALLGDQMQDLIQTVQRLKAKVVDLPGLADVTATGDDAIVGDKAQDVPNEIFHLDGQRVAYLRANLTAGQALGEATAQVVNVAQGLLPAGVTIALGGDSQRSDLVIRSFSRTSFLSVVGISVILLLLFQRLLDPLVVILSLPLSIVGAMLGLLIAQSDVGMISLIGVIFLLGIVNKNAILIVDYTNQLKRSGLNQREALLTAAPLRLRPIVMTTLSTILGMLPIALGWGAGAELRQPMAVAIIGGLTTSTILSLIVVPVLYSLIDDLETFLGRSWQRFLGSV
ncbi:MAG: efflux RND transporter permease subunit, partial [Prochlorotrichaceae cyanobacterium]